MNVSYTPLEPNTAADLGITDLGIGADAFSFSTGQAVSFLSSVSLIWTLGIMACVGGAVFVIIRGGISRMEASEAGIRKSNEEWKRASLGLLGVMILWLIIYTVNRGLLVGDIDLTKLSSAGGVGINSTGNIGTQNQTSTANNSGQSEQDARAYFANLNISINNPPCASGQTSNCTNVAGLPSSTLSMLRSLRLSCPSCVLVITGGTEPGHASHGIGLRPVDLRITTSLSSFLQQNGTPRDTTHTLWGGYTFWNETAGATSNTTGDHYHVY